MNGSTGGAEMNIGAPWFKIVFGIAGKQRKPPRTYCQRILDQGTRKPQAAIVALRATFFRHQVDTGGDRVSDTNCLKKCQGGFMDLFNLGLSERLVFAALHARANRSLINRNGARAHGFAGFTATAAAVGIFSYGHSRFPRLRALLLWT